MSQDAVGPIVLAFDAAIRADLVAVGASLETIDVDLYIDGPVPTNEVALVDYTVATFNGYAQLAAQAGANGISDEGEVLRVYPFSFTAGVPVAPFEGVKGLLITGNDGGFLAAIELPTPIVVDEPGEMIAGQIIINFTTHEVEVVQAIP